MTERFILKFNLARNCLRYVIKAYGIEEIFLPYYICPALIKAVRKENCHIKFYHIDNEFFPAENFEKNAFIVYPNYFGICAENVLKLNEKYKNLIVDNAHNFYMMDCGLASFNSIRKFFSVRDGAELFISKKIDKIFEKDFCKYENFDVENYEKFVENETRLDNEDIKFLSDSTEKIFTSFNLEKEKQKRLEKFRLLHEKFGNINELKFTLNSLDVPFVYPLLLSDETTGKILENGGHRILRYWEALPEFFPEYRFYKYLIPLNLNETF